MKLSVCALSVAMLLSSCGGMTNTAKGGLIGGAALKVSDFKGIIDAFNA